MAVKEREREVVCDVCECVCSTNEAAGGEAKNEVRLEDKDCFVGITPKEGEKNEHKGKIYLS